MKKYFYIFTGCFVIFIIHLILDRHGIYGDGNGYYAYTQALVFDKGLNFGPIYNFLGNFMGAKGEFSRFFWDRTVNPYPIGTGIVWIPSVALISLFFHDRFSMVFEMGPGITGILLVIGGMYFLKKYLRNFFSEKIAAFSVLFFFFTSNLFYYSSFEPALSHQPSFFIISFLLYKTYKFDKKIINYFLVYDPRSRHSFPDSGLLADIKNGSVRQKLGGHTYLCSHLYDSALLEFIRHVGEPFSFSLPGPRA